MKTVINANKNNKESYNKAMTDIKEVILNNHINRLIILNVKGTNTTIKYELNTRENKLDIFNNAWGRIKRDITRKLNKVGELKITVTTDDLTSSPWLRHELNK